MYHIKGVAESSDVWLILGKHREYERNRDKKSIKLMLSHLLIKNC